MGVLSKLFSALNGPAPIKANRNHVTCVMYSVKGKNPETGRKKTVTVISDSAAPISFVHEQSGLMPPYEVNVIDQSLPTENQIKYATRLGFSFPADATMQDASVFLSRAEDDLPLVQPAAPDWMVNYALDKGIFVSPYSGPAEVSEAYLWGSPQNERAAYFCMRVFCVFSHKSYLVLEDASDDEIDLFFEFGDMYGGDSDFTRSLSHYGAADLPLDRCVVPKRLKAYDIASAFLKVKGAIL